MGLNDLLVQRSNLHRELEYAEHAGETNGAGDHVLEQHWGAPARVFAPHAHVVEP